MTRKTIEEIVPGVAELRARERHNRALAFAGITRTVCGLEIRPLTPAARLELQLLRNAFAVAGAQPLEGDVFVFLWILHPRRGRARGVADSLLQWRLRRRVRKLELAVAVREIRLFMIEQLQDLPESTTGGSDLSPWVHWMGSEASWWMSVHHGFTLEGYLSTPYLVLQQLFRGWKINNPEIRYSPNGSATVEEPQFINASDRLVGQYHVEHRAAAATAIRQRRHRI